MAKLSDSDDAFSLTFSQTFLKMLRRGSVDLTTCTGKHSDKVNVSGIIFSLLPTE